MAKSRNSSRKSSKPAVKVQDLSPKNDPKGGRKTKDQQEYLIIKMKDIVIT